METRRWVNQSQPDTMQIAVWLLYFRAVFTILFGPDDQIDVVFTDSLLMQGALGAVLAAGGFGIANEQKWGYYLALTGAVVPLLARALLAIGFSFRFDVPSISPLEYDIIGLLFEVALLALLLHPRTREYERIWFK